MSKVQSKPMTRVERELKTMLTSFNSLNPDDPTKKETNTTIARTAFDKLRSCSPEFILDNLNDVLIISQLVPGLKISSELERTLEIMPRKIPTRTGDPYAYWHKYQTAGIYDGKIELPKGSTLPRFKWLQILRPLLETSNSQRIRFSGEHERFISEGQSLRRAILLEHTQDFCDLNAFDILESREYLCRFAFFETIAKLGLSSSVSRDLVERFEHESIVFLIGMAELRLFEKISEHREIEQRLIPIDRKKSEVSAAFSENQELGQKFDRLSYDQKRKLEDKFGVPGILGLYKSEEDTLREETEKNIEKIKALTSEFREREIEKEIERRGSLEIKINALKSKIFEKINKRKNHLKGRLLPKENSDVVALLEFYDREITELLRIASAQLKNETNVNLPKIKERAEKSQEAWASVQVQNEEFMDRLKVELERLEYSTEDQAKRTQIRQTIEPKQGNPTMVERWSAYQAHGVQQLRETNATLRGVDQNAERELASVLGGNPQTLTKFQNFGIDMSGVVALRKG